MYSIFFGAELLNTYGANGVVRKGPDMPAVVEVPRPVSNNSYIL